MKACPCSMSSAVRQRKHTLWYLSALQAVRQTASAVERPGTQDKADASGRAANLPQLRRLVSGSYDVCARRRLHKPQPRTGSVPDALRCWRVCDGPTAGATVHGSASNETAPWALL